MRVFSIETEATAKSLAELIQDQLPRHTGWIGLQAPEANSNTVYFGDRVLQPFELRPKASANLPVANFNQVFVKGPGQLSVVLFDV